MSNNSRKIIAFNYFGGKFTWLEYLYQYFPQRFVNLIDVFAGSMVVSLNYHAKVIKTANEINGEITNFFEVLRNNENELIRLISLTPCSRLEYNNCYEHSDDNIEQARRFYVRARQSFFGLGAQRTNKGFHMAKSQLNCNGGETVSRWNNSIEKLHQVAVIIRKNFQITNEDFADCIDRMDSTSSFFYCDPPYPKECRHSYNDYKFEFSDEDHKRLSIKLHSIKGMAMVSGYDCELMTTLYSDWTMVRFPIKKNNIRSNDVQECVWINYKSKDKTLFDK